MAVKPEDADKVASGGAPWWAPLALGAGAAIVGSITQYKLSSKQQNTAHQREVKDLTAAGLNPMLSAQGGRGSLSAEIPVFGDDVQKGMASALALKQMKANVALTEAQTFDAQASASGKVIDNATKAGSQESEIDLARTRSALAAMDLQQRRATLGTAIRQAEAQLKATLAGAELSKQLGKLRAFETVGAKNLAELEKDLGEGGAAAQALAKALSLFIKAR